MNEMMSLEKLSETALKQLPDPKEIENYFDRLWPLCRSLTGQGVRDSLAILKELIPLETVEVPSGTKVYDWTVPNEWNIEEAWIESEDKQKIIDFKNSNLHVMGYSTPIDQVMELEELQKHLYSLPDQPDAIPYLTSYYKERWGFCLTEKQRQALKPGKYRAVIRSTLKPGSLTFGHYVLKATEPTSDPKNEILFSTNICHPSLANNELSGPLATAFLFQTLSKLKNRRFNYRFVFIPETVGAIAYLNKFGDHLKKTCHAGFTITCCGDDRTITYKKTRQGDALVDKIVEGVLKNHQKIFSTVEFFPSGSDERQYCSPGFNLPIGSLMRSMYGSESFPEYHTSLDNKSVISFPALLETIELYLKTVLSLEANRTYIGTVQQGEPMLGPRGLYSTIGSQKTVEDSLRLMMWILNMADGKNDLLQIAEKAKCSVLELANIANVLLQKELLIEKK